MYPVLHYSRSCFGQPLYLSVSYGNLIVRLLVVKHLSRERLIAELVPCSMDPIVCLPKVVQNSADSGNPSNRRRRAGRIGVRGEILNTSLDAPLVHYLVRSVWLICDHG